jgi:glycosyltransferase involved in cell wall biosynthesis
MSEHHTDTSSLTFTVLIPAFNSADTVGAAIESVLAQTQPAHEILVIDDGSEDATAAIAETHRPLVRVLRKPNGGTASARNLGIAEATGEVVAFLDADDVYRPTHLEEIDTRLRERPQLAAVATDTEMRAATRTWRNGSFWPNHAHRDPIDVSAPIIFCALGIRRSVLRTLGEFDRRFHILEDVEMHHRMLCNGHEVSYVDSPSYVYNVHEQSKSQSGRETQGRRELFRINLRYALYRRTPLRFRARLAVRAVRHGIAAIRAA